MLYVQVKVYQNILKLRRCPLVFTVHKAFLKNQKRGLELVSMIYFLHDFEEKCFLRYILLTDQVSLPLVLEILGDMCIVIICCPDCNVINFGINLNFLIRPFFFITKKSRQKCKEIFSDAIVKLTPINLSNLQLAYLLVLSEILVINFWEKKLVQSDPKSTRSNIRFHSDIFYVDFE